MNQSLIEDSKLSLKDFQEKVAGFMVQFTGISHTVTSTTLNVTNFTDDIYKKMQNSYNQNRSGDILIALKPGWMEDVTSTTTHNSAYSYDTHVPLIWYGWKIKRTSISKAIKLSDIAPTIATMLKIELPNGATGKAVHEIID